jgi:hypothetical protein
MSDISKGRRTVARQKKKYETSLLLSVLVDIPKMIYRICIVSFITVFMMKVKSHKHVCLGFQTTDEPVRGQSHSRQSI